MALSGVHQRRHVLQWRPMHINLYDTHVCWWLVRLFCLLVVGLFKVWQHVRACLCVRVCVGVSRETVATATEPRKTAKLIMIVFVFMFLLERTVKGYSMC